MSQLAETPFSNMRYFQAILLYGLHAKAVAAQKRRRELEKIMVIERL
jgi:hypothetical protein